jgi:hypothetical protein
MIELGIGERKWLVRGQSIKVEAYFIPKDGTTFLLVDSFKHGFYHMGL